MVNVLEITRVVSATILSGDETQKREVRGEEENATKRRACSAKAGVE